MGESLLVHTGMYSVRSLGAMISPAAWIPTAAHAAFQLLGFAKHIGGEFTTFEDLAQLFHIAAISSLLKFSFCFRLPSPSSGARRIAA
jgi:hypothetical protein